MDGVLELDTVFQYVRQAARRFRLPSDAVIAQQILLLGDAFYGYRFTAPDFKAIWSASDQTLKVFDSTGRISEIITTSESAAETIPFTSPQRNAA